MSRLLWVLILTPLLLVLMPCEHHGAAPYVWLNASADPGLDRLMAAIEMKDERIVRESLRKGGIDLRSRDRDGLTALTRAARSEWVAGCRLLLDDGADPNAPDERGLTALHYAAMCGGADAVELVDLLIARGADARRRGFRGNTPLHNAALYGRSEVVARLLSGGAELNAAAENGCTALHYAALAGSREKVAMLLAAGADPKRVDSEGRTPADIARQSQ